MEDFNSRINQAKNLVLNQVIRFLTTEAEYADIRDIKVAADVIKNLESDKEDNTSNTNVLIQSIATKFNLPENPKVIFQEDV